MKETVLTSVQSPRLCVLHFHIREAKRAVSYRPSHDEFMKINVVSSSLTEGCTFSRTGDTVFNVLVRVELFVSSAFLTGGASPATCFTIQ